MLEPLPLELQFSCHSAPFLNSATAFTGTAENLGELSTKRSPVGHDALYSVLEHWLSLQPSIADIPKLQSEVFGTSFTALESAQASAASVTPLSSYELGTLYGRSNLSGFVDGYDPQDIYYFQLDTTSNLDVSLNNLDADADLYLAQDLNQKLNCLPSGTDCLGFPRSRYL